jgi:hypothetical protein
MPNYDINRNYSGSLNCEEHRLQLAKRDLSIQWGGDSYMSCIDADRKYPILKAIGEVATMLRTPTPSSHIRTGLGVVLLYGRIFL